MLSFSFHKAWGAPRFVEGERQHGQISKSEGDLTL
jgi:hypothetical protein